MGRDAYETRIGEKERDREKEKRRRGILVTMPRRGRPETREGATPRFPWNIFIGRT